MSREIKFRAYNHETRAWYYWDQYSVMADEFWTNPTLTEYSQFTGLKDKNGVEIYEGDIVRWNHDADEADRGIDAVEFKNGCFYVGDYYIDAFKYTKKEVIGNIYETPELLEDKQTNAE